MSSFETKLNMTVPGARSAVVETVLELVRVNHRLFEIMEDLRMPWDVVEMWGKKVPHDSAAELFSTVRWVRTDLVKEAISKLSEAAHKSDADLRFEFLPETEDIQ